MATPQRTPDTANGDQPYDLYRKLIGQEVPSSRASGAAPRSPRVQNHGDPSTRELLDRLLAAPPAAETTRRRPVVLRSAAEQRRVALRGYQLRTWVDTALHQAERLLFVAAVLVFGYWLIDGPVRDWMHARQASSVTSPVAAAPLTPLVSSSAGASSHGPARSDSDPLHRAPLPFIRPQPAAPAAIQEPHDSQSEDFIAPRQRPLDAPIRVAPPQPTHLLMPSIGVDTPVREVFVVDGAWEVAEYAAGYLHGTSLPGDGNTVLAGHAGIRGAVFRDLGSLNPGDDVFLDAGGWRYHYRVRDMKAVGPEQVEVLDPATSPILTMLTCTNWDTQRLVVVADLVDSKPSPGP